MKQQNIKYIDNPDLVELAIQELKRKKSIAYDIETNGLDPLVNDILLIQLGDPKVQYVFDVYKLQDNLSPIINYLNTPRLIKIAHNAKFEYSFTKAKYGVSLKNWVCTQMGSELLSKGIPNAKNTLDACLDKFVGFIDVDKRTQKSFIGMPFGSTFTQDQIDYAAEDVQYLHELWYKQQSLIDFRGMSDVFELENETIRVVGDMELNGIFVNHDKWLALKDDAMLKAQKAKEELDKHFINIVPVDLFGEPVINYNSPPQLKSALSAILKKKLESTNEDYLKQFDHEVIDALFDYREARKRITTYGKKFLDDNIHPVTGRIHPTFLQMRADTGRMSSARPNLQNIPKEQIYRTPFQVQSLGYKMISADFSG